MAPLFFSEVAGIGAAAGVRVRLELEGLNGDEDWLGCALGRREAIAAMASFMVERRRRSTRKEIVSQGYYGKFA